jgi:hypothetical protein
MEQVTAPQVHALSSEQENGWPARAGKVVLQIALTRLARHYGLISESQAASGLRRRLQHWGVEGYRPQPGGLAQDAAEAS